MAGRQVHTDRGAERHAGPMRRLDPDRGEEGGDMVGITLGGVRPGRLVAVTRAGKVDRNAGEVLGKGRKLERIASMIRTCIRDQQKRLTLPLHLIVGGDPVNHDLWHARSVRPPSSPPDPCWVSVTIMVLPRDGG